MRADLRALAVVAILAIAGCGTAAVSGPSASPVVVCDGIPMERCDEAVESVGVSLPNTAPARIEVICVSGTCTEQSGAIDTVVTLPDGSQLRSSTVSWQQAVAPPPGDAKPPPMPAEPPALPVEPQCQGAPVSWCRTMAETAFGELTSVGVVSILVRCTTPPCTDDHGEGDTTVTYNNGTVLTTAWEYAGG